MMMKTTHSPTNRKTEIETERETAIIDYYRRTQTKYERITEISWRL